MFTGKELEPWEGARLEQQRLGSSPISKDPARDELFGSRRPSKSNEVVRAGRSVTDLMPFVDLDSPISLLDANKAMAERAIEIALKAGPKNDGSFAGLLRSPRATDARHVSDNSIAPYNDGTAISEARALAATISNGRYNTTQTRIRPGCAAPMCENYTVYDPKRYLPPPPLTTTDISSALRQRVPTHPTKAGAEARWDTTEYRRHPTDLRPASIDPWSATVGRQVGEASEYAVPQRPEYRRRVTDLSSEGSTAGDGWGERRHPHDLSYAPPPLRPPPVITAGPPPPMVPNHRSVAPWPQDARRPILCTDVTSHSDEANRTRNAARSRRQREMHGLAPAVPLELHADSPYGHGLHTTGLHGGYGGDRYSEVERGTGGSFTAVERTGPWVARKPGEVERRPGLATNPTPTPTPTPNPNPNPNLTLTLTQAQAGSRAQDQLRVGLGLFARLPIRPVAGGQQACPRADVQQHAWPHLDATPRAVGQAAGVRQHAKHVRGRYERRGRC